MTPGAVWVGNLPPDVDEFALGFHVGAIAPVAEVRILRRGLLQGQIGVVELRAAADVARVVAALDGSRFEGRRLRVRASGSFSAPAGKRARRAPNLPSDRGKNVL